MAAVGSGRGSKGFVGLLTKANRLAVGLGLVWSNDGVPVSLRLRFVDGTSRSFNLAAIRRVSCTKSTPPCIRITLVARTSRLFDIATLRAVTFHGADTIRKRLQVDAIKSQLVRIAKRTPGISSTTFSTSRSEVVRISINSVDGEQMHLLAEERFEAGEHVVFWRAAYAHGDTAPPGACSIRIVRKGLTGGSAFVGIS